MIRFFSRSFKCPSRWTTCTTQIFRWENLARIYQLPTLFLDFFRIQQQFPNSSKIQNPKSPPCTQVSAGPIRDPRHRHAAGHHGHHGGYPASAFNLDSISYITKDRLSQSQSASPHSGLSDRTRTTAADRRGSSQVGGGSGKKCLRELMCCYGFLFWRI